MYERYQEEIKKIQEKYPIILDTETMIRIMKIELMDYIKKLVPAIKKDYGESIPEERLAILEGLMNEEKIKIINDPDDKHDYSANSKTGEIIINLDSFAKDKDNYEKIVKAKGGLPHEIFHIVIRLLKSEEEVDERIVINTTDGGRVTSRGMCGFMLNEGFVEKMSGEFCKRHDELGEDFYHTLAPQLIPYIEVCDYIMKKNSNINPNTVFKIDYQDCLNSLSREEKEAYQRAECISYGVRHKNLKREAIQSAYVEKIDLKDEKESTLANFSKIELLKLKRDILTEEEQRQLATLLELEETRKL